MLALQRFLAMRVWFMLTAGCSEISRRRSHEKQAHSKVFPYLFVGFVVVRFSLMPAQYDRTEQFDMPNASCMSNVTSTTSPALSACELLHNVNVACIALKALPDRVVPKSRLREATFVVAKRHTLLCVFSISHAVDVLLHRTCCYRC